MGRESGIEAAAQLPKKAGTMMLRSPPRPKSSQHYCRAGSKVDRPTGSDETPPRLSAAFSLSGEGFAGLAVRWRVSDRGGVITSRAATERPEPPFPREVSLSLPENRARVMTGLVSL